MKKLRNGLVLLILLLAISACQNNDEVLSPNQDTEQSLEKITMTEINFDDPGANTCIDLVAGNELVVGEVCVDYLEGSNEIKVIYNITEEGWTITKTHLASVIHPFFFPRKWTLEPKLSNFPYQENHDHVTSVEYIIDAPNYFHKVYLGIHAKVEGDCATSGNPILVPDLPNSDLLTPEWLPSDPEADQYLISGMFTNIGTYYGWSIDNSRLLSSGLSREVRFVSSYDELPTCSSFLDHPENLDLVNWIINHRESNWDRRTVQAAIWKLLDPLGTTGNWFDPTAPNYMAHDEMLRESIINLANQNGENFEPGFGEKVLILAYGPESDPCDITKNIIGIEYTVESNSEPCVKHAWAFPFENGQPTPDFSKRFSWIGWARYIKYQLQ
jgi:hypothetical protein